MRLSTFVVRYDGMQPVGLSGLQASAADLGYESVASVRGGESH